jgi:hypothetical protein
LLHSIPIVKFDSSRVIEAVKSDLRTNIEQIKEFGEADYSRVFDAAIRSIAAGRDLRLLRDALLQMNVAGMTKQRAAEIATLLNNKATVFMNKERLEALGIKYAIWMYSGAPCYSKPKAPLPGDMCQNAAHLAADGERFEIGKGMLVDGKWTWPGREEGCRCTSRSVIRDME